MASTEVDDSRARRAHPLRLLTPAPTGIYLDRPPPPANPGFERGIVSEATALTDTTQPDHRPYRLSQDAYPAVWDQAGIVLHRGRYKGFGRAEIRALVRGVVGWPDECDHGGSLTAPQEAYLKSLVRDGLLTVSPDGKAARPVEVTYPTQTLLDRALGYRPLVRPIDTLRFVRAVLAGRLRQPGQFIEAHASWIRDLRARSSASTRTVGTLVHVFRHLRPLLFAGRDRCVLDSLALLKFLSFSGASLKDISWVVGVRMRGPAHCWLQSGAVVINDTPERVRKYKPIFVA